MFDFSHFPYILIKSPRNETFFHNNTKFKMSKFTNDVKNFGKMYDNPNITATMKKRLFSVYTSTEFFFVKRLVLLTLRENSTNHPILSSRLFPTEKLRELIFLAGSEADELKLSFSIRADEYSGWGTANGREFHELFREDGLNGLECKFFIANRLCRLRFVAVDVRRTVFFIDDRIIEKWEL